MAVPLLASLHRRLGWAGSWSVLTGSSPGQGRVVVAIRVYVGPRRDFFLWGVTTLTLPRRGRAHF